MQVKVTWVTDVDDDVLGEILTYLDGQGPSPVDWVSQGLHAGAKPLVLSGQFPGEGVIEILVEGPDEWRASHDPQARGDSDTTT